MIDFWALAKEFKQGDTVQRLSPTFSLSPYVGRVTAVHRGIAQIDVQWPYANERMSPDEIVRVNPKLTTFMPPEFDQSYSSYDVQKARSMWASRNAPWAGSTLPAGLYSQLAKAWGTGLNEMAAYDTVWHRFASQGVNDESLRNEVEKFYLVGSRMADLRIKQHAQKSAAYWVAQNRQYRVSQGEIQVKKPNCPKCGSSMKRTTYKMDKGARVRLFACPRDLFLIKSDAILGPQGEILGW